MSIEQMRDLISDVYPGDKWKEYVINMPDFQVLSVYNSFAQRGILLTGVPEYKKPTGLDRLTEIKEDPKDLKDELDYRLNVKQLTIDDILNERR